MGKEVGQGRARQRKIPDIVVEVICVPAAQHVSTEEVPGFEV